MISLTFQFYFPICHSNAYYILFDYVISDICKFNHTRHYTEVNMCIFILVNNLVVFSLLKLLLYLVGNVSLFNQYKHRYEI